MAASRSSCLREGRGPITQSLWRRKRKADHDAAQTIWISGERGVTAMQTAARTEIMTEIMTEAATTTETAESGATAT